MNASENKVYEKLPGKGAIVSLGLLRVLAYYCDDHLLLVISESSYKENYKRFYFKDVQAFLTRKTKTYTVVNVVMSIIMLFLFLFGVLATVSRTRELLFLIVPFFLAVATIEILNLLGGPSCEVLIQTAVQREKLGNISNLKTADKNMAILLPLIRASQGGSAPPAFNPTEAVGENIPPADT
ncbi:MAG: hypothetical protein JWN25_3477 [Verrucomicrobiales bacterium]|nr:hypothetical protein [Verrucomicrobiales bacterium]